MPAEYEIAVYGALVDGCHCGVLSSAVVHEFCVERARLAFERETALDRTAAWLRRARYVLPTPSAAHVELNKRFETQYKKTANAPALPTECAPDNFRGAVMGDKEAGHTDLDRLDRFARRVYARHPFIVGIERVNLQRRITGIHRPTLLPLNSARGLRLADQGRHDQLPCVLDDVFTRGEGPLLVRILLSRDTSPKQRDAAYRTLASDAEIFDSREVLDS